jgi:hypothetical protein
MGTAKLPEAMVAIKTKRYPQLADALSGTVGRIEVMGGNPQEAGVRKAHRKIESIYGDEAGPEREEERLGGHEERVTGKRCASTLKLEERVDTNDSQCNT